MTKYDKIFDSKQTSKESLSPEEGVAAIAVITAGADSSLDELDADALVTILWDFEIFEEYSEDEITEIVDRLIYIGEQEGLGALFNIARESLSDDVLLDAFAAGVIILLDPEELVLPKKKQPYLKKLQEALDLEDEEAQEIIQEVIAAFQEAENDEFADDEDETVVVEEYSEQVYESPLGNFSLPIPVDPQQGGRIQSQEGVVGFSDDFGTFLRIDYYPLPDEQVEEIESTGQQEYLQSVLVEKYVPQAIIANLPNAQIQYSEYLEETLAGAYYILVDMPQGSTISKQENNGTAIRLDAYRGLLAFIKADFLYIISNQRSFFNGQAPGLIEDEAEELKENLLDFVETIEFT
ncbi:MAG: tellurite resistance TerB family protein [Gloeotrichia echinulata IR180]